MNERFYSYEWQSQNRPATTPAMLAERAMQAVKATLEKSESLITAGSSQSMTKPLQTTCSSYNNAINPRGGPELNKANLGVRGMEYRSLPQGQFGFQAEDRRVPGWCENSLNYDNPNGPRPRTGPGVQQVPMWPGGDGHEGVDQGYDYRGDEDYRFPREQNRFGGMHDDNYASSVEKGNQSYEYDYQDDFYPPEQYETAGGFGNDSRDNHQSNWLQDNRNFPTRPFGGYGAGRGRGRAGRGPEQEGFGQGFGHEQPTRYPQEDTSRSNNRIVLEQKAPHHGREQKQPATVPNSREISEHSSAKAEPSSGGFNQLRSKTSAGIPRSAHAHRTDDPTSNSGQQQTKSHKAKTDKDEEDEGDDDDASLNCKLCGIGPFESSEKFLRHTRGLMHTQRQMVADEAKRDGRYRPPPQTQLASASAQPERNSVTSTSSDQKQPTAATVTSSVQEQSGAVSSSGLAMIVNEMGDGKKDNEKDKKEAKKEDGLTSRWDEQGGSHCKLCDIDTTGTVSLRSHLSGHVHKKVAEAVASGTPISRSLASKLGPEAQIPNDQKPATLPTGLESGSSALLKLLKTVREAIVGLKHIKEYQVNNQLTFYCTICESHCDSSSILTHLTGSKHRMRHLRDAHPDVYELVRSHDGKKSELSAFLEEVCADIEQKEGRGEPILGAGAVEDKEKVVKVGDKPAEKGGEEKKGQENKAGNDSTEKKKESGPSTHVRHLPHAVVLSRYKEEKRRKEMLEKDLDPDAQGRGKDGSEHKQDRREAGRDYERGRSGQGPWRRDEDDPRQPRSDHDRDRSPQCNGSSATHKSGEAHRSPRRFPPFEQEWRDGPPKPPHLLYPAQHRLPPPAPLSEEERYRRMYAYERHNFFYPEVGVNYDQARARMFHEYERLGIPYEMACSRVQLQEDRRMRLLELKDEGLDFDDACNRVIATENRSQLMREYEQQGLTPHEAKYRVIVEEERRKLFEGYEQKGILPQEARRKIIAAEDRRHLIREYERHGMPSEIALQKAVAEEMRFRKFEESRVRGQEERSLRSSKDTELDDIAERNMLENYMEQGIGREEAENKVITLLRQQGVAIQEAVKRVQSIVTKLREKRDNYKNSHQFPKQSRDEGMKRERSPDYHQTRRERNRDREEGSRRSRDRDRDDDRDYRGSRRGRDSSDYSSSRQSGAKCEKEDFDSLTPEEAKERLLKEYEKRGVSRADACKALIGELIKSGIPLEEAQRRFFSTKSRHDEPDSSSSNRSSHRSRRDDHHRSRSRSPRSERHRQHSPNKDRSGTEHRYGNSRSASSHLPDYHRSSRDREKENRGRGPVEKEDRHVTRQEHNDHSGGALDGKRERNERSRDRCDKEGLKEPLSPSLTAEELRMKRKREALLSEGLSGLGSKLPKLLDMNLSSSGTKPGKVSSSGERKTDVSNLFDTLTTNLISSKDDSAMAVQMSKALSSALLKYKFDEVHLGKSSDKGFAEKHKEDAKKLLQTKLHAARSLPASPTQRKPKVTFDPSTCAREMSQRPPWPRTGLSSLATRRIPIASQNPPSAQEVRASQLPQDPKRVLYEAQRQQRLERLSTISQFGQPVQWGASHNIVVKSQNLGNKSNK